MAATETYPVRVDASLDAPRSRWLWLVKWVLVIPHYIVLFFLWTAFAVLSAAAIVGIVVTGRYPQTIFEFPPFRLDMGGADPGTLTLPLAAGPEAASLPPAPQQGPGGGPTSGRVGPRRWTAGQIVSAVTGAVLVIGSIGLHLASGGWDGASALIGTVRIRVTPVSGTTPAFIGIAPATVVARYLAGVDYATVIDTAGCHGAYGHAHHAGSAPAVPPTVAGIWTAQAAGPGTRTLTWTMRCGDWMVVALNADGSRPVSMRVNAAATLPALPWIAAGLLVGGFLCLIGGIALIAVPLRRASWR